MLLCFVNLANRCQHLMHFSIGPIVTHLPVAVSISAKHLTMPMSLVSAIGFSSAPTNLNLMFGEEINFSVLSSFPVLESVVSADMTLSSYSHALIRALLLQFPHVKTLILQSVSLSSSKVCTGNSAVKEANV